MDSKTITMKSLHERLTNLGKNEIVLDVRAADEYAAGHVPGSVNIPHDQVQHHAKDLGRYDKIYIHCQAGKRAQVAFAALERLGLRNLVCISDGGMADWTAAGFETAKG